MTSLTDEKLVKFYSDKWTGSQVDFCKQFNEDPQQFARFIAGHYESARSREALKQFWERFYLSHSELLDNPVNDSDSNHGDHSPPLSNAQQQLDGGGKHSRQKSKTRNLNLLQNYYNLGMGDSVSNVSTDPLNIDSPSFDLKQYFEHTIKTSTLPQLVSKDNELVSEIRTLDGDMKTLVYDNYTKFINATDIIKKMKNNVENMEDGMQLLSKNMELITTCSDKINSTLSARRERIDQLSGLHKLLKKLQYLTALPSKLNSCVEMQAYNLAVKYYNSNNGILKQYNHIPSFQTIQAECDEIITSMKSKLYEKLAVIDCPQVEVGEAAELLMELLEPVDAVRTHYLKGRKEHTLAVLYQFDKRQFDDVVQLIGELNQAFLTEYTYNIESYKSLFVNRFDGTHASKEERKRSLNLLEDFSKDLFNRYLSTAKSKLTLYKNPEQKIKGLELMYSEVSKRQDQLVDTTSITDIINATVHDQITDYFDNLQKTIQNHIHAMNETLNAKKEESLEGNFLQSLSEKTAKDIVNEILLLFTNLKPFFLPTQTSFLTSHYATIFTKIQVKLQNFFLYLNIHFLEYLDIINQTENKEQFGSRFLLVLASVCLYIESKGITIVVQVMNDFFNVVKQGISSQEIGVFNFNAPDLSKRIKDAAQSLLTGFTKLRSEKVEKLLRKGLESNANWLVLKEPKDARQVNDFVLDELLKISTEVTKLLPSTAQSLLTTPTLHRVHTRTNSTGSNSGSTDPSKKNAGNNANNSSAAGGASNTLFDKRFDVFSPVDFNANSILVGAVKIMLKTYIECLRLKTFGTNGYHQIQVDLRFLKLYLTDQLGSQTSIDSLIQECETTVHDRCIAPIPLEESIIVKLCESHFQQRKEELAKRQSTSTEK
ncbi:hypothetical protein DFA_08614 [Cavenderia fasciculata]|uniref:Vacuolar protein sorting-associated protein 51 homolog n=1 Tax=Cavenderia fasciculata TaxID=261658 RepID=F4Q3A8_CACFS|nr:uncharacterized protein DFA_08614 [Cavenderia fasciculata]EGG17618.1 hypothetical protein DFA_08614 [Cavenderia fasciculata]|eukprot:XP_004356102.1 hypothetical protein DFA_08614 [Cavenderia fasciculata]